MANKKPKNPEFVSPSGVFRYPKLTEPDYGTDDFPKPDGEYSTRLILSEAEAQPLLHKLQPLLDVAVSEAEEAFKKLPVASRKKLGKVSVNDLCQIEYDQDTEEATGNVIFKFAMKASGKTKAGKEWSRKPVLFDAKGHKMPKPPAIWGGTEGKVAFEVRPYFISGTGAAGLKLSLNAAQIINLVTGGGRDAEGYGFGEEDGFEASEAGDDAAGDTFPDDTSASASEEF